VNGVATKLRDINKKRGKWIPEDDAVLGALDKLGSDAFDAGISALKWIVPSGSRGERTAEFLPETLPKIKRRRQQALKLEEQGVLPTLERAFETPMAPVQGVLEGMLEPLDGKARIRPILGAPRVVSFRADQAEDVLGAAHKSVRVTLDSKARNILEIEVATPQQSRFGGGFFEAKTIDALIAEQRVLPITDLTSLAGAIPENDVEEFVAEIYKSRAS
jgi:hypothetical protein